MKPNETSLNTPHKTDMMDELGDDHVSSSIETPLRKDAFEKNDALKIELIQNHFKEIMHILGLDLTDDSIKGTTNRVENMFVNVLFGYLNPAI